MKDWIAAAQQNLTDADRARRLPAINPVHGKLMRVTAATAIAGQDKRWLYTVREAVVGNAGASYVPSLSVNGASYDALSVSELTNGSSSASGTYSYGVAKTNLSGTGFIAVQIPTNTWVWCVPHRSADGSIIWLIVNTQAIDGVCT